MLTDAQKLKLFHRLDYAALAISIIRNDPHYPDTELMEKTVDEAVKSQARLLFAVVEGVLREHLAKPPAEVVDLFKGGKNEA